MKRWLREPLVHFLGLGALLFILNGVFGNSAPVDSGKGRPHAGSSTGWSNGRSGKRSCIARP